MTISLNNSLRHVTPSTLIIARAPSQTVRRLEPVRLSTRQRMRRGRQIASGILATAAAILTLGVATAMAAPPEAPEVTVAPVTATEATLHATLNPGKTGEGGTFESDEYQFLYNASKAKECAGGAVAPASPGVSFGGGHEEVPAEAIAGLTPGTEYAVCLRVVNPGKEATLSAPVTFTTAEVTRPAIEAQSASEPTSGTVSFSATINPNGAATTCELKYGTTSALEATPVTCPAALPPAGTGQAVTVSLKGLQQKTEYHFEFLATNEKGTETATQATFQTGPLPPVAVTGEEATEVKRANAVLHGFVIPYDNEATSYYYEYGPCSLATEACALRTPVRGPLSEPSETETAKVTRLKPGTVYHYWLVASGPGGTAHGEEVTFTTASAEPEEFVLAKDLTGASLLGVGAGVGVNQASGDIYLANSASGMIEQFTAAGVLQSSVKMPKAGDSTWQLAVDNSGLPGQQGDVYVADITANVLYKFDPNAEGALELDKSTPEIGKGSLNEPRGVAVDAGGNVYVASAGTKTVSEFSPTGAPVNAALITGLSTPLGLAVDKDGDIYVAGVSGTVEYTSTGTCAESCTPISEVFDESVAVDSTGNVFISVLEPQTVREYAPGPGHPPVANPVLEQPATFSHGFPEGLAVNSASNELYVSEDGGSLKAFRFLAVKPVVISTEPATPIPGPGESLNGTINPGGQEPAEYYFEYGTSPCSAEACGTVVSEPGQVPVNGDEPIPVSVRLENLPPDTTYHYRLVGANEESGVEYGGEQTFTTGPQPSPSPLGDQSEHKTAPGAEPGDLSPYPDLNALAPVPAPTAAVTKSRPRTRAQKLQKALRACHKVKQQRARASCERMARKDLGTKHKVKRKK